MDNNQEITLTVTLRNNVELPIGEVIDWLKSFERKDLKQKIEQALIMAYLPYARAESRANTSEVECCFWETQDLISKHGFYQSQVLNIRRFANISEHLFMDNYYHIPRNLEISPEQTQTSNASPNLSLKESKSKDDVYRQIDELF